MIPPLYNALLSGDFPTLTKIVDRAKLWETKNKEAWAERDRKRKMRSGQSSKGKSEGASVQVTSHNQNRGGPDYQHYCDRYILNLTYFLGKKIFKCF